MSDDQVFRSAEAARDQPNALCIRLAGDELAAGRPENACALRELLALAERLQADCGLLHEILDRTSDMLFAKDRSGRYLMNTPSGASLLGRPVEAIIGRDDTALHARASAERIMAADRTVMSTGASLTLEVTVPNQGVPLTLRTTESPWYGPLGELCGLIGMARNVSTGKRVARTSPGTAAEKRLRESLAADLHDGLGQYIALAEIKLAALRGATADELRQRLAQIERLMGQADRAFRAIAFQLSPVALPDPGLMPALHWLAEEIGARHCIEVRIEDEGAPRLVDRGLRVVLLRAVREVLLEAATREGARLVRVRLTTHEGTLRISIEGDGEPFQAGGLALRARTSSGIREQLELVGGSVQLEAQRGRGTAVTLSAPLAG